MLGEEFSTCNPIETLPDLAGVDARFVCLSLFQLARHTSLPLPIPWLGLQQRWDELVTIDTEEVAVEWVLAVDL